MLDLFVKNSCQQAEVKKSPISFDRNFVDI